MHFRRVTIRYRNEPNEIQERIVRNAVRAAQILAQAVTDSIHFDIHYRAGMIRHRQPIGELQEIDLS